VVEEAALLLANKKQRGREREREREREIKDKIYPSKPSTVI
jgi:hypothetical protein